MSILRTIGVQLSGLYMPDKFCEGIYGFKSRRGFLRLCAAVTAATVLPACEEWRSVGYRPSASEKTSYITSNDDFYLVAVDTSFRPVVTPKNANANWSLDVYGLDGNVAARLGYNELISEASRVVPYTFECIGNPVDGQLIGNAQWHVVPLKEIIKKAASGSSNVRSVLFEGLDDFYSSVSVQRTLDDYAFIAVKMNGVPLPPAHGFPARVILPDLYGMKQPRWLRSIKLLEDKNTTSYWEKRGWAGEVPIKTMSRIDARTQPMPVNAAELTGIAFGGARGVKKVEVSLDNEKSWQACELVSGTQANVWSLWRYDWRKAVPGRYTVTVRATDGKGVLQTSKQSGRFPDGASGYPSQIVELKKA
jgi:DMSO/TMAO reductase YedYZ molybdopterin-dependent catalytic subunit